MNKQNFMTINIRIVEIQDYRKNKKNKTTHKYKINRIQTHKYKYDQNTKILSLLSYIFHTNVAIYEC
jgi:hypothetical protein